VRLLVEEITMFRWIARNRWFAWLAGTGVAWLWSTDAVWAAEEAAKGPPKNNWVMAYILVLLAIGLGLMAVLRPGRRTKEIPDKPGQGE
jgi:hypothetical protein